MTGESNETSVISPHKRERDLYPISGNVILHFQQGKLSNIYIGNTGFGINIDSFDGKKTAWHPFFTPDGYDYQVEETKYKLRYSLLYAFALTNFVKWWQNVENWKEYGIEKPDKLSGGTPTMNKFREHLLGREIYRVKENRFSYTLDLQKLIRDEAVMDKLENLSERCRKRNYKTQVKTGLYKND